MKLIKYLSISVISVCVSSHVFASTNGEFEKFMAEDSRSNYAINYTDYDAILKTFVMPMGKSSRAQAKKSKASVGTRLKNNINKLTALEGNRFLFEAFKDKEYKQLISDIRRSLEAIPDQMPLSAFNKEEQLAYWLNLYNVTMLDELNKQYPVKKLKDLFDDDSFMAQDILTVSGVKLSLNDIQYRILAKKYDYDPLINYGLYQGIIGSPNLKNRAYTGDNVYEELTDNAVNFVNSNRGTYGKNKKAFRVSSWYKRNEVFFPDFNEDLRAHLLKHLEGYTRYELEDAKRIKANINDWNITDVYGTMRQYGGGVATNQAALLDPYGGPEITGEQLHFDGEVLTSRPTGPRAGGDAGNAGFQDVARLSMAELAGHNGRFSIEQMNWLKKLNALRLEHSGIVTITDIENDEQASDNKDDALLDDSKSN